MGKKILCVDDELDMRIFISTVLKTQGYEAIAARNAVEGIRKAREVEPDLIVMDVMMPQAGGVTLFQEIKKDERLKHVPVIMLTGVSEKAFAHHLKMLNIRIDDSLPPPDAYMEKPLNPETLVATIERLLR
ncbi:MAG: response regulator [Desulfobacterales bacterium]|nr:response regulator [Desulfobacterales bacterium]